jgi:hypothetical protein
LHPFGWARESIIFLCMQTLDGFIDMRLRRRWFYPFRKILVSQGKKVPTFIPQANEFARKAAKLIGGTPMSMVTEILFNVPGTAHILGGCPMAGSSADGVVDHRNRVFGYKQHVHLRWLRAGGQPGSQPQPDHLRGDRAGHEFHPTGRADELERRAGKIVTVT